MSVTEFLTARYDEGERFTYNPALMPVSGPGLSDLVKRARADIAAKRAIVAAHPMEYLDAWGTSVCTTCTSDLNPTWTEGGGPCTTLRLLAQPYAQHPDFDPDWRVA